MALRDGAAAVNVTVRAFTSDDAGWLDAWLPDAAAGAGYDGLDRSSPAASLVQRLTADRALAAWTVERDGAPAGIVLLRRDSPGPGAATFELVAVDPRHARRGTGQRAAALIEDLLASRCRRFYAPAPAAHGISLYFWIRLGYRPLLRAEWPCERPGVAWLARDAPIRSRATGRPGRRTRA